MNFMGREIPSFTEWLSNLSEKQQAQAELVIVLVPFFAGYFVFLYNWIFLWKPIEDSVAIPSVITSVGYIIYYRWLDSIRSEAQAVDAHAVKVRWNSAVIRGFTNVVAHKIPLLEKELFNSADPTGNMFNIEGLEQVATCTAPDDAEDPPFLDNSGDVVTLGNQEIANDVLIGDYYEKVYYENMIRHPLDRDKKTNAVVYIMDFPYDKTFRKTPGHSFSYKGTIFPISAGNVDVTFIGYQDELELVFFFRVTSSQERTRLIQMKLGLATIEGDLDEANNARFLESAYMAIAERLRANRSEGLLKVFTENFPDAEKDAYRGSARLVKDLDKIRENKNAENWRTKINWKVVLGVLILGLAGYWYYTEYYLTGKPLITWILGVFR